MNLSKLFRGDLSINARLLLWFLAISVIPGALVTGVIEYLTSAAIQKTVRRGLMVISEAKSSAIESYVHERRGDVSLAGHLPFVSEAVNKLSKILDKESLESPEYLKESERAREVFSYYRDAYGYSNAFLFDVEGKVLFRLDDTLGVGTHLKQGPLRETELSQVFDRCKILLQSVFSDFQIYPGKKEPIAFTASPIFDEDGIHIGVIILQLGNREVFSILNDSNGLGETGEAVAALLRGDELNVVAPTRFDPTAFRRRQRLDGDGLVALDHAVQGERGFGEVTDVNGRQVIAVWSYIPSLRWGLVVKQDVTEAYELVHRLRMVIAGLSLITLLVVFFVARKVAHSLSRPIHAVVDAANEIAGGNLTTQLDIVARGEVGMLVRAVRKMNQDLRSLIGRVQKSSITLMSAATEIAATSRQQEQTVNAYGASTNEAAAAVKEISATGQELLRTMTEVNSVASDTARMATHGQESLAGMDKTMRSLADSTTSIGSKLSVISERAATVNLVVTTITKVADQTNLLSINAAIEAEKAGEYGLGFLVVAREIRRLADQTAVSTLDIDRMVKEMQYSVSAGVMEMDKFSDQVRQGVREAAHLGEQLGQIIHAVQGLTDRFDQVTEGMRVQAQGADQIREAIVHLSDGVNQTLTSLREFNQATAQLREAVGGLKDEVSRFRVDPAPTLT